MGCGLGEIPLRLRVELLDEVGALFLFIFFQFYLYHMYNNAALQTSISKKFGWLELVEGNVDFSYIFL